MSWQVCLAFFGSCCIVFANQRGGDPLLCGMAVSSVWVCAGVSRLLGWL